MGRVEGSKGQISLNFKYKVNLCVLSQIKDRKHIERNFHSVAWVMSQGSDFGAGCWRVKIFSVRICVGTLWTALSSLLMSSADNFCKQFCTRSGLAKCRA